MFGDGAWPIGARDRRVALLASPIVRARPRVAVYALVLPLIFAARRRATSDRSTHLAGRCRRALQRRRRHAHPRRPARRSGDRRHVAAVRRRRCARCSCAASGSARRAACSSRTGAAPALPLRRRRRARRQARDAAGVDGFDYADYLARRGIVSTMEYPAVARRRPRRRQRRARDGARACAARSRTALTLALPEPQASLAQGVLLGAALGAARRRRDDLNATNTSHLVVVSGSNVVLVSAFVTLLFALARRPPPRARALDRRRRRVRHAHRPVAAGAARDDHGHPAGDRARVTAAARSGVTSILLAAALMVGLDAAGRPRCLVPAQLRRDGGHHLSRGAARDAGSSNALALVAPPRRGAALDRAADRRAARRHACRDRRDGAAARAELRARVARRAAREPARRAGVPADPGCVAASPRSAACCRACTLVLAAPATTC